MLNSKTTAEIKWLMQRIKNIYHLLQSVFWTVRCGYPAGKMTVIGVTGTDGKTTTCTLIYEILKAAGYRAGIFSTVGVKYINGSGVETEIEKGLHTTNPDAGQLQPLILKMRKEGVTHLVLEVTAHGVDQFRVWGCNIKIGVLTNITREHLDDFVDMERYRETKLRMISRVKYAVLNAEDAKVEDFKRRCTGKICTYTKSKTLDISPALAGEYNRYNIGAAEAAAKILGINNQVIKKVVKEFPGVPGRMEEVKAGQKFRVIVDFAHTPNALKQVLKALAAQKTGKLQKLIAVFGCTGERDAGKRPLMGKIAAEYADTVIVTSDDTRTESQDEIFRQITAGIGDGDRNRIIKENDRRKAIGAAIKMAKPGDIVLLAGKGHEKSILIGKTEYPWSDAEVAREIISSVV